jgi:hypothetical protein
MALKDMQVRALKPRARVYKVGDEHGLYIEVHPNGSKPWRLKYPYLGRDKRTAFGRYPEVGLAEARQKRDAIQSSVIRNGKIWPIAGRRLSGVALKERTSDMLPIVSEPPA